MKTNFLDIINPFFWEQAFVYWRSSSLVDKEKYEEAKEYLKKFLRKKHYVTEAHYYMLGIIYFNLKDYGTAEKCFQTSLEYNPYRTIFRANTLFYLALTYYESNNFKEAKPNFQEAIDIKEKLKFARDEVINLPHLYCYLGRTHKRLNEHQKAFESFNKGLKFDPDNEALQRELTLLGVG